MRLGEVQSDEQAFRQILGRLEGDVGTIVQLLPGSGKTAPWALVRMMFPIAESLGGLIYHMRSTAENLRSVLAREFEAVRQGIIRE